MGTTIFKVLLSPIAALYGLVITLRNGLYSSGLLKSARFNLPVIGVGNLTVGGAGKTPHVEYLIRLLSSYLNVATLSKGYKRKSRGFRIVNRNDSALTVGDEPLQYFLKYPYTNVAVSESRSVGIPILLNQYPETEVVLLDDSYQHRSVDPGLNILLTEYNHPYIDDHLLPSGRLREWASGADRADIVIATKCPADLTREAGVAFRERLNLQSHQRLFFSKYIYGDLYNILDGHRQSLPALEEVILVSAIANEAYLLDYVESIVPAVHPISYEDHHLYSPHEVSLIHQQYEQLTTFKKAIVTTEKDATRLILHRDFIIEKQLPVYILPVQVSFLWNEGVNFNTTIRDFLLNFKV